MTYNAGDLIWYKNPLGQLFLLKCIRQNNSSEPNTLSNNDVLDTGLNESGWEN